MYTIGDRSLYDELLQSKNNVFKLGIDLKHQDGPYYGGAVFPTDILAHKYIIDHKLDDYDVYQLEGNWKTDTYKLEGEDFYRINKTLRIINEI